MKRIYYIFFVLLLAAAILPSLVSAFSEGPAPVGVEERAGDAEAAHPDGSPSLEEKFEAFCEKQSQFVQELLDSVLNPATQAQIYLFFRKEMRELEDIGTFLSEEDFYTYRRNQVQDTLGGQHVKSIGEKWIADFLFEHDIRYAYEAIWFWDQGGGNYQPDFSLVTTGKRYDIVIEHWGIDLTDPRHRQRRFRKMAHGMLLTSV